MKNTLRIKWWVTSYLNLISFFMKQLYRDATGMLSYAKTAHDSWCSTMYHQLCYAWSNRKLMIIKNMNMLKVNDSWLCIYWLSGRALRKNIWLEVRARQLIPCRLFEHRVIATCKNLTSLQQQSGHYMTPTRSRCCTRAPNASGPPKLFAGTPCDPYMQPRAHASYIRSCFAGAQSLEWPKL